MDISSAKNPYVAGPPVSGAGLYGRDDVFAFVKETLASPRQNAIFLFGQRRMGKTSILLELPNRLPASAFHIVFFDLENWVRRTLPEILHGLAEKIAASLNLSCPPLADFQANPDEFHVVLLPRVWDHLGERHLLLLLDEFDALADAKWRDTATAQTELFTYLQRFIGSEGRLAFVFVVGRRVEDLPERFGSIYKQARYKSVGLLERLEAKKLITEPARNLLAYDEATVDAILALTARHPYFTQLVCQEIFNRLRNQRKHQVTPGDVEAVVERALEAGETAFVWFWRSLTPSGQILLSAIAHVTEGGEIATEDKIRRVLEDYRVKLPPEEWTGTPGVLVEWGILTRTQEKGLAFAVELVRRWVVKTHPLNQTKLNLMNTFDASKATFEKAQRQRLRGELNEAVKDYRTALAENPNHMGAQLGLAQALRELNRLPEAVDAFEDAFWLDEIHGRDGLVEARFALGERLEAQGNLVEANLHFRRVAKLAPNERRLNEKLQILYEHGLKAASSQRWGEAAQFFERVVGIQPEFRDARQRLQEAQREITPKPGPRLPALAWAGGGIGLLMVIGVVGFLAWGALRPRETPTPGVGLAGTTVVPLVSPSATVTPVQVVVADTPTSSPSPGVEPSATPTLSPEVSIPTPSITPIPSPEASTSTLTPSVTPTATETPTPIVVTATPTSTPTAIPTPTQSFGTREALDVDIDPLDPRVVYAVAKGIGIFKSTDAGGNWKQIWPVEGVTPGLSSIESLTIHPSDPKLIFAAGYDGILKSEDGGGTWREVLSVADSRLPIETQVHAIALVPNSLNIAYAATDRGVFKSFDGGLHWDPRTQAADGEILARPIYTIAVASQDDRLIYAAGQGDQIYRSEDGVGTPWQRGICSGCGNEIYVLAVDPSKNNRLYAGGSFATFAISDNGGSSWAMSNTGLSAVGISNLRVSSIAVSPQDSPTLFAGTGLKHNADSHGIYRRQDSGQTWTTVNSGLPLESSLGNFYVQGIAIGPTDSQIVYLAGFGGVYKSTDGGDTWSQR
jgi:photosystem II stability/assembly factor-like uncharacterized protein/Tfp pilus assembly protein PilF